MVNYVRQPLPLSTLRGLIHTRKRKPHSGTGKVLELILTIATKLRFII